MRIQNFCEKDILFRHFLFAVRRPRFWLNPKLFRSSAACRVDIVGGYAQKSRKHRYRYDNSNTAPGDALTSGLEAVFLLHSAGDAGIGKEIADTSCIGPPAVMRNIRMPLPAAAAFNTHTKNNKRGRKVNDAGGANS